MLGNVVPCALCQAEAATVYCVNDDAHLCATCDTNVHASNPLLARHERRPLACAAGECASAAHGQGQNSAAASPATTDSADVAVVPQLCGGAAAAGITSAEPASPAELQSVLDDFPHAEVDMPMPLAEPVMPAMPAPAAPPAAAAAPLSLYEDSFFARSLTTSDLLDMDGDDLELPGSASTGMHFACFDPLDDCVVPHFGAAPSAPAPSAPAAAARFMPAGPSGIAHAQQSSFLQQPGSYLPSYLKPPQQQPTKLVPMGGMATGAAAPAAVAPKPALTEAEAEAAARVQRHRERQRKKRAFGRTVRYQSRRAYAEIRPRIKGRFVTPEEYAAYQAQQGAAGQGGMGMMEDAGADSIYIPTVHAVPTLSEEDAVVPVPAFVA